MLPPSLDDTVEGLIKLGAGREEAEALARLALMSPTTFRYFSLQQFADLLGYDHTYQMNRRFVFPGDTPGESITPDSIGPMHISAPGLATDTANMASPKQSPEPLLPEHEHMQPNVSSDSCALDLSVETSFDLRASGGQSRAPECIELTSSSQSDGQSSDSQPVASNVVLDRDILHSREAFDSITPNEDNERHSPHPQNNIKEDLSPRIALPDMENCYQPGGDYLNFGIDLGLHLRLTRPASPQSNDFAEKVADFSLGNPGPLVYNPASDYQRLPDQHTSSHDSIHDRSQPNSSTITGAHPQCAPELPLLANQSESSNQEEGDDHVVTVYTSVPDGESGVSSAEPFVFVGRDPGQVYLPRLESPFQPPVDVRSEPRLSALQLDEDVEDLPHTIVDAEPMHPPPTLDTTVNVSSVFSHSLLSQGTSPNTQGGSHSPLNRVQETDHSSNSHTSSPPSHQRSLFSSGPQDATVEDPESPVSPRDFPSFAASTMLVTPDSKVAEQSSQQPQKSQQTVIPYENVLSSLPEQNRYSVPQDIDLWEPMPQFLKEMPQLSSTIQHTYVRGCQETAKKAGISSRVFTRSKALSPASPESIAIDELRSILVPRLLIRSLYLRLRRQDWRVRPKRQPCVGLGHLDFRVTSTPSSQPSPLSPPSPPSVPIPPLPAREDHRGDYSRPTYEAEVRIYWLHPIGSGELRERVTQEQISAFLAGEEAQLDRIAEANAEAMQLSSDMELEEETPDEELSSDDGSDVIPRRRLRSTHRRRRERALANVQRQFYLYRMGRHWGFGSRRIRRRRRH